MMDDKESLLLAGVNDAMADEDRKVISLLKDDERAFQEIISKLTGIVIGGDISGIPRSSELKPGESTSVQIEIPRNYFALLNLSLENEESLLRMLLCMGQLSLRSVLAQSGLDMPIESPIIIQRTGHGNFATIITLENHHPHATIKLPKNSFRCFRLFVPAHDLTEKEIRPLLSKIIPAHQTTEVDVTSYGTVQIPIVRTAEYDQDLEHIDIMQLTSNRSQLDRYIGLANWQNRTTTSYKASTNREMQIAETIPIEIPYGLTGVIQIGHEYMDRAAYIHGHSILIDGGFKGPIRVEYKSVNATQPPEYVEIRLYRNAIK